jgi:hypothetical protein
MSAKSAAGHPNKIMIIRHGEKPQTKPGKNGPFDVLENGKSGNGNSLIVIGWQRAGALNAFFAPHKGKPAKKKIATPDSIYAANPAADTQGESKRPWETVTPLAAWLGYRQGTPQFNTQYHINGGESQLVQSVLRRKGTVLICWEHDNIMPNIVGAIHKAVPIKNYKSIPPQWPDVFYLVWIFDLDKSGKKYKWRQVRQDLMPGDVKQ